MSPDTCTSLNCSPPNKHCSECSHANFEGSGIDSNGKEWRWTFNPRFGPLFLGKRGSELAVQPGGRSRVWPVFEKWMKAMELK